MYTIESMIRSSATAYPERIALQLGETRISYRDLWTLVSQLAFHLRYERGLDQKTVGLVFQNTIPCIISFLALGCAGARVIPLTPEIAPHELETIAKDIPCETLLGEQQALARLEQITSQYHYTVLDCATLLDQVRTRAAVALPETTIPDDAIFLYHYTSGSSGKPKAALHSQRNLVVGAQLYQQVFCIGPDDSTLISIPLAHSFGMIGGMLATLTSGARLILFPRFIPARIVELLGAERVSILISVPLAYDLIVRSRIGTVDLRNLRICLSSGAPLPQSTAEKFQELYNLPIYQVYGSTESGVIAAQWPGMNWPEGAIGAPLPGVELCIVDDTGNPVEVGTPGTLLVRTPAMFFGYHNQAQATNDAFVDGWYRTGDIACRDASGFLYLTGRKDTFINIGGKKVNPLEVEEVLMAHPAVVDALVYGQEAGSSEQVYAAVVTEQPVSLVELLHFCRERLAAHKVPAHIEFLAGFPKTSSGKTQRMALIELLKQQTAPNRK